MRRTALPVLIGSFALAACAPHPVVSPPTSAAAASAATATPAATRAPTPVPPDRPTEEPSAAPALTPDSVAQVVTTDLVLRSAPGTTPDSEIYGTLDEPTLLYVLGGPESASGYEWYQVYAYAGWVFTPIPSGVREPHLGWVAAAAKDGEPWIASASLDCVAEPQIEDLARLGVAAPACYGAQELTFPAMYRYADALIPSATSPAWLYGFGYDLTPLPCAFECPAPTPTLGVEPDLYVHAAPGSGYPSLFGYADNTEVEVVGHFDDPAAQSCVSGVMPGDYYPPAAETVLLCRAQFVVTEMTEITR